MLVRVRSIGFFSPPVNHPVHDPETGSPELTEGIGCTRIERDRDWEGIFRKRQGNNGDKGELGPQEWFLLPDLRKVSNAVGEESPGICSSKGSGLFSTGCLHYAPSGALVSSKVTSDQRVYVCGPDQSVYAAVRCSR